jgi:flagellar biosynthesis protein FlhA
MQEALTAGAEHARIQQVEAEYPPVLLVSPMLRPSLSRILRRSLPDLAVISYAEIPADKRVETTTELETMTA